MNELEDAPMRKMAERVRDAFGAAAQTVTAQDLPGRPDLAGRPRPARRLRVWPPGLRMPALAPVAAAVCVAAIAVTATVVVPNLLDRPAGPRAAGGLAGAPAFFAGVAENPQRHSPVQTVVNIYSSATGRVVASFRPPHPEHVFAAVARLGSGRTFVAAAETRFRQAAAGHCTTQLYRFTIDARGRPSRLTPLSVPQVGGEVMELVGSADGNVLAYTVSGGCSPSAPRGFDAAGVIHLAAQHVTTWKFRGSYGSVSLTADGSMLGFAGFTSAWILPTSAPRGLLTSHARKVLDVRAGVFRMVLNRTGSQAYVETQEGTRRHPVVVLVLYSTATGKPIRQLGRLGPRPGTIFSWLSVTVDATVQHMIIYGYFHPTLLHHPPAFPGQPVHAGHPHPQPVTEMNLSTGRQVPVDVTQEPNVDTPFDVVAW